MPRIKNVIIFLAVFTLMLLGGCIHRCPQEIDPTNLAQLENLSESTPLCTHGDISPLRLKALEDTALGLGAQGGLAWSSEKVNVRLEHDKKLLDSIYNFNGMMLSHGVIPPVLVQGDFSLNLADPNTIRVADKTYKIIAQARFATTPPNWREYLQTTYAKPELPRKFLLPRNSEERKIWIASIQKGWDKGIEQSYNIFQQNLSRLKRDYNGMILYRKLLQQRMISPPYVSRTELGVTGDGSDMRVNDQVLRITVLPKLETQSNNWKPILVTQ